MKAFLLCICLLLSSFSASASGRADKLKADGFPGAAAAVAAAEQIRNLGSMNDFHSAGQLYVDAKRAWETGRYSGMTMIVPSSKKFYIFELIEAYSDYLIKVDKNMSAAAVLNDGMKAAADSFYFNKYFLYVTGINRIYLQYGLFSQSWQLLAEAKDTLDVLYPYTGFETDKDSLDVMACHQGLLRLKLDTVIASGNPELFPYDELVHEFDEMVKSYRYDPRTQFFLFEQMESNVVLNTKGFSTQELQADHYFVNIFLLQNFLKMFLHYEDSERVAKLIRVLSVEYESNITFAVNAQVAAKIAVFNRVGFGGFSGLFAPFDGTEERVKASYMRFPLQNTLWMNMNKINYMLVENRYTDAYRFLPEAQAAMDNLNRNYALLDGYFRDIDKIDNDEFNYYMLKGKVLELTGKYADAAAIYRRLIGKSEQIRKKLPVELRRNFFNGIGRDAYLGMIRIAAFLYEKNPTDGNFNVLLESINRIHARQLKDLNDHYATSSVDLSTLRNRLSHNDLIYILFDVDSAIVIAGISKDKTSVSLFPKNAEFDKKLITFKNNLVNHYHYDYEEMNSISAPLFAQLENFPSAKRLHILSEGTTSTLPFDIYTDSSGKMLHHRYQIDHLATLDFKNITAEVDRAKSFLGIGDPNYAGQGFSSMLARYFVPLPETRDEINTIAAIFTQKNLLLGNAAKESVVKQIDMSAYNFIHFATHGILGGELTASNEPALVLSAEEGEDGLLSVSEVSKLKINADITVLSACNTGSGKYFRGEGLSGIGRAFKIAGSKNLLVSLWPVDSFATKTMMETFYRHFVNGKDFTAALYEAKAELMKIGYNTDTSSRGITAVKNSSEEKAAASPKYDNPYFWSAFILISG